MLMISWMAPIYFYGSLNATAAQSIIFEKYVISLPYKTGKVGLNQLSWGCLLYCGVWWFHHKRKDRDEDKESFTTKEDVCRVFFQKLLKIKEWSKRLSHLLVDWVITVISDRWAHEDSPLRPSRRSHLQSLSPGAQLFVPQALFN